MARRRKSSKISSKCPEPINTFINLAAGLTTGIIAARMEKKYHYKKKGVPNPYTATAIGFATGSIKSHRDILRTGAILNAMGSFDVEADDEYVYQSLTPENPVFHQIRETGTNNNRYAWRLNCEDGSAHGISPYDFETRAAYHAALARVKDEHVAEHKESIETTHAIEPATDNDETFVYVRVSRLDNGVNEYYLAGEKTVKVGDIVQLPTAAGNVGGVVLAVEKYKRQTAPQPPEDTARIV